MTGAELSEVKSSNVGKHRVRECIPELVISAGIVNAIVTPDLSKL